jgi:PhnB protein
MQVNPYLTFNGNCAEAFTFYERLLGGRIVMMMTHAGSPAADHTPPEWQDKIIHARLLIGDQVLMGSDAPPQYRQAPQGFSVSLQIEDPDEGERIFNGLAEGGTVRMPFQQTFWAARFGMCVDRFGIPWMVNCEQAKVAAS